MTLPGQSRVFKPNIFFWKIFGMWPEETSSKYYYYYCVVFVTITSAIYWFLFTLSLLFTPIDLEIIIAQAMFYFTEIAGLSKIGMIIFKQNEILKLFELLDSEEFQGDEEMPMKIVNDNKVYYLKYWKACAIFYYTGSFFLLFLPVFEHFFGNVDLIFPLCQYYFLSDNIRDSYFTIIFLYQFFGLFVLITCNVNIDTFICGLLLMAITQYKVLNWKLSNLCLKPTELSLNREEQDKILMNRLNKYLKHYDQVLRYCRDMQKIMGFSIFAQFGTGAATICVSMCTFLRPMTNEDWMFMGCYIGAMTLEIFLPGLLGAQLTQESADLAYAVYCSDWISQPEKFKRNLRLMVESANKPIVVTGLQMFSLSLETFASIIKMAYSFFTLLKNVQAD